MEGLTTNSHLFLRIESKLSIFFVYWNKYKWHICYQRHQSWFIFSFRCCSASNIVKTRTFRENDQKDREQITCPGVGSQVLNLNECSDGSFQEIILDSSLYSIDSTSNTVTIQNQCDSEEPPIVLNQKDNNFCVR